VQNTYPTSSQTTCRTICRVKAFFEQPVMSNHSSNILWLSNNLSCRTICHVGQLVALNNLSGNLSGYLSNHSFVTLNNLSRQIICRTACCVKPFVEQLVALNHLSNKLSDYLSNHSFVTLNNLSHQTVCRTTCRTICRATRRVEHLSKTLSSNDKCATAFILHATLFVLLGFQRCH
jgi:hypothetical protein